MAWDVSTWSEIDAVLVIAGSFNKQRAVGLLVNPWLYLQSFSKYDITRHPRTIRDDIKVSSKSLAE